MMVWILVLDSLRPVGIRMVSSMFEEFERVVLMATGRKGTIVDKVIRDEKATYIVEDDEYINGEYPLYDCADEDLMRESVVA